MSCDQSRLGSIHGKSGATGYHNLPLLDHSCPKRGLLQLSDPHCPPGDAGPSAIDWVLMGGDGAVPDSAELLQSQAWSRIGRSHWGVTILQAVVEMDAGSVWAFEQFEIDMDASGATKATLHSSPVTITAITATMIALGRITSATRRNPNPSTIAPVS
ncbi:sensor hoxx [Fusarium heterosporum]|uniref:Sensor hoxx n=1 Tax=Fusarium heterosporum TaxID=42747 RepID=A0A8H5TA06_FUSHE|nr:sensor hoxx [Fusarium heterosporum]